MHHTNSHVRQQGFSLIELMVGIVVAMAAVIVIMQVFSVSEGSRRSTTGGDDAQSIGAIALTVLQRDLRQAGEGFSNTSLLGCDVALQAGWTLNGIAPITINHADIAAGDAGSDTLLIVYGTGLGSPEGDRINTQPGANVYGVATATAFHENDRVIAAPPTRLAPCGLRLAKVFAAPVAPNVTVDSGTVGVANGVLYNLGPAPRIAAYAVRNGRLTVCDFQIQDCRSAAADNWAEIADGIVSLRAQYGRDTSAALDSVVDGYDQTNPATACGWSSVLAMRMVLVARNGQLEKTDVTAVAPTWSAGASAPITLAGNWQRYRYKTFETTIPLRNVAWQGVPTGC